ncbi:hypothetical protein KGF57_004035 [Candida theae]|uniref:DASH complex subunit SPC34 n=1 Tax=Candida theae TaxID=1198502 RepID=A0AAD5FXA7_9ASCO|nr:uncharacterized protein KGF57_004035 [Candida theae]KAI5953043.1 hypothetical protein KGF57_004035 [Candida theae]
MSLSNELDRIDRAAQSVKSYVFKTPGMFTNSIVNPPPIQTLLRDPTPDERSLYKVTTTPLTQTSTDDPKVERVDGKSMYQEFDFDDSSFITMNESENVDYEQPIVKLPTLYRPDPHPVKIDVGFEEGGDLYEAIELFAATIDKYPNVIENYDTLKSKIDKLKQEFVDVSNEIQELESELASTRKTLWKEFKVPADEHAVSSGELIDLDAEIQREENEIRQLQAILENRM